jgi:glycosyltransferase involved in cell wall biosynthesis
MKILLVAPQPFYTPRGTPIAVRLLVESLCEFGHQVDLLVYHAGEDIQIPGMRLIRAGRPPGVHRVPIGISVQKLICDVWLIARMIGLLRRNHYDVVHAVEEAIFPAALFDMLTRRRRKLIYDMDSSLADQLTDKWRLLKPLRGLFERLERSVVQQASATFAVCEDLAAKIRPWVGEHRVTVLPDVPMGGEVSAAQVESLRAIAGSRDALIGLYVGNLERYQGIDLLIEGMAELPADVKFQMMVIGGDAADVERYRTHAHMLGLTDRLHFLGARPLEHLNSYLAQADVLVSPRTLGQNTPMKVYSYMQSGKAILATDIRSHTQALDAGCAHLVPVCKHAFAAGLQHLVGDIGLRERLGNAAREKAEEHYSLLAFKHKLRTAYERVAHACALLVIPSATDLSSWMTLGFG